MSSGSPNRSEYGQTAKVLYSTQHSGRGQPPSRYSYGNQRPTNVHEIGAPRQKDGREIRWREGSKGWLESRFMAVTGTAFAWLCSMARPPHKEVWLLVEWPEDEKEPTKYFLCDLPPAYTLRRLVRLAKARWKIEQDYQQLKEELGLDHYEGRNWAGWHHHVDAGYAGPRISNSGDTQE